MKQKLVLFAVGMMLIFSGMQLAAIDKEMELPLGTKVETPMPNQLVLVLPDGRRLELHGSGNVLAGFQRCVLRGPQGKILTQGMKVTFVQPSTEKVMVLPPSVRLVAYDDQVVWARQGAPVPDGSYLRIDDEVVWLPTKLHFTTLPARNLPITNPKKPGIVPR